MQFPVPQFIDVEDKIIGPFSLKQFGFVAGGGLLVVALFKIFQWSIPFFILGIPIALVTLLIAFGNFNGMKIYQAVPIFIKYFTSTKVMVFKKESNIDNLNIHTITVEQVQAESDKQKASKPVEVESVQTQLKRLSRLLDQKDQEQNDLINKK